MVTMRLDDFVILLRNTMPEYDGSMPWETHIEVKRYARFALHSIFEAKFGKGKQ